MRLTETGQRHGSLTAGGADFGRTGKGEFHTANLLHPLPGAAVSDEASGKYQRFMWGNPMIGLLGLVGCGVDGTGVEGPGSAG